MRSAPAQTSSDSTASLSTTLLLGLVAGGTIAFGLPIVGFAAALLPA